MTKAEKQLLKDIEEHKKKYPDETGRLDRVVDYEWGESDETI